jgi:DnaK suppressor protein
MGVGAKAPAKPTTGKQVTGKPTTAKQATANQATAKQATAKTAKQATAKQATAKQAATAGGAVKPGAAARKSLAANTGQGPATSRRVAPSLPAAKAATAPTAKSRAVPAHAGPRAEQAKAPSHQASRGKEPAAKGGGHAAKAAANQARPGAETSEPAEVVAGPSADGKVTDQQLAQVKAAGARPSGVKPGGVKGGPKAADGKTTGSKTAGIRPGAIRVQTAQSGQTAQPVDGPGAGTAGETGPEREAFLARQQELLLAERNNYTRQAEELRAQADALALEHEPGDVQFDEEGGEGGTANVDRELDLHLSAQAQAAVEEIDAALAKIGSGAYGFCESCGTAIPSARLEALPHARLCVTCKSGGLTARRQ